MFFCFSSSPTYFNGVVSVKVPSLSLHKTGDLVKEQSCSKSQPKRLTLTQFTAGLIYRRARHDVYETFHTGVEKWAAGLQFTGITRNSHDKMQAWLCSPFFSEDRRLLGFNLKDAFAQFLFLHVACS